MSQSSLFDPLPTGEDFLLTAKKHIRRGYVVERFVISAVVVVLDEAGDGALELPRIIGYCQVKQFGGILAARRHR